MSFGGGGVSSEEAEALIRRAEKSCKGGFLSFLSGGPNYEDAAQLYVSAANKYKLIKAWPQAAECLLKAAYMQQNLRDPNQEANLYADSANIMLKYSFDEAIKYYNMAINIYNTQGRFSVSAKIMKSLAETHENEHRLHEAAKYYKQAADYYDLDDYGKSTYSQCMIKYAEISSKVDGNVEEAIKIFEKEGEKALKNSLIQYSAKEYFLKAGILHVALGDPVDAKLACKKYEEMDPRFANSREGKLLSELVEAFESSDTERFVEALYQYDSITELDKWKTHFLYKVKASMPSSGEAAHESQDLT